MPALTDGARVYVCDLIMCVQRATSVYETEAAERLQHTRTGLIRAGVRMAAECGCGDRGQMLLVL